MELALATMQKYSVQELAVHQKPQGIRREMNLDPMVYDGGPEVSWGVGALCTKQVVTQLLLLS